MPRDRDGSLGRILGFRSKDRMYTLTVRHGGSWESVVKQTRHLRCLGMYTLTVRHGGSWKASLNKPGIFAAWFLRHRGSCSEDGIWVCVRSRGPGMMHCVSPGRGGRPPEGSQQTGHAYTGLNVLYRVLEPYRQKIRGAPRTCITVCSAGASAILRTAFVILQPNWHLPHAFTQNIRNECFTGKARLSVCLSVRPCFCFIPETTLHYKNNSLALLPLFFSVFCAAKWPNWAETCCMIL
jgi:hypothetical protein